MESIKVISQRRDWYFNIFLVIVVSISLINAVLHDPYVGYDAEDYVAYIKTLSQIKLPGIEDTGEFFTPPLPFVIPALLIGIGKLPPGFVLKIAQLINVLLALGSLFSIRRLLKYVLPEDSPFQSLALLSFLSLPVFYKTHAFVRAEPYLLFFLVIYIEGLIRQSTAEVGLMKHSVLSGLAFGAALLSRQWAILILPGVAIYAYVILSSESQRKQRLYGYVISGFVAFIVSGWFYLSLFARYGSLTTFNRDPFGSFSLENKSRSFFLGLSSGKLFSDPIRDSYDNQLLPILYTETWGDYWGYFVVYGEDFRSATPLQGGILHLTLKQDPQPIWLETNRDSIAIYLGRVNLLSILPTTVFIIAYLWSWVEILRGIRKNSLSGDKSTLLFSSIVTSSILGYLWFLIQYPSSNGDTIKATYILHIFPFLSILVGAMAKQFSDRLSWILPVGYSVIGAVFLHNIGTLITRFLT